MTIFWIVKINISLKDRPPAIKNAQFSVNQIKAKNCLKYGGIFIEVDKEAREGKTFK